MINTDSLKKAAAVFSVELSPSQLEQFDAYAAYLTEYNKMVNLTAITDPMGIAVKHFEDSLALLQYVPLRGAVRVADVGTGAGFPAVPLLIAEPTLQMTMIEATGKKLVFIENLLAKLGLQARTVHLRGEEAGKKAEFREQFDCVTARAVAEMRQLAEYCLPLVKKGGMFVSMKSSLAEEELSNADAAIPALGGKFTARYDYTLSNGDPRTLLTVKKISQTSSKYPRASALIAKKPL